MLEKKHVSEDYLSGYDTVRLEDDVINVLGMYPS